MSKEAEEQVSVKEEEKPTKKEKSAAKEKPSNVDEAVKFYSKRWGVSEEEATEKIQKLLEERKAPTMEEMFPEPLGEISRKVQDVNQALLSTAYTRKKVADLENPTGPTSGISKDIDSAVHEAGSEIIKNKLTGADPIRTEVDKAIGEMVGDAIRERLKGTKQEDLKAMLDGLFDEFGEKVVKPLYEKVQALEKEKGTAPSINETADLVFAAETKYKEFLEKRGFKVESVNITKDSVQKMISDAVAANQKTWEEQNGATVQLETERIKATENILSGVTDRVFDVFLTPLKDKIQEAIDRGAFRGPPAGQ